jgi:hypothetical protein
MRTLYLRRELSANTVPRCAALHVTPLLRELIIEAVSAGQLRMHDRYACALRDLLIVQIEKATPVPTFVMLPLEERALVVAQVICSRSGKAMVDRAW